MNSGFDPKKLGEEADQMIAELNARNADAPDGDTPATADSAAPDAPVADQADTIVESGENPDDQGVTSPDTPGDLENKAVDFGAQIAELQKQITQSDQRWKVSQGMITKKDEELTAMRQLLSRMAEKAPTQQAAPVTESAPAELDVSGYKEDFGSDMVAMVQQVANHAAKVAASAEYGKLSTSMNTRIGNIEGSVQGVASQSQNMANDTFEAGLDRAVEGWRELNEDEGFNTWLEQADQFAGVSRLDLLSTAVTSGDAQRAAMFFKAYQSETAPAKPVTTPAVPATKTGLSAKERLVAPGKTKAAAPIPESKSAWDGARVNKLYDDKRTGAITKQQFDTLERDMFAAQSDGRWAA